MTSAARIRLLVLVTIGAVLSVILLVHDLSLILNPLAEPSFCSFSRSFDCDAVARSAYAQLFGIPISSFALFYYLALWWLIAAIPVNHRHAASAAAVFLVLPIIPSILLFFISAFVVQALCLMCLLLYVLNIALLCLSRVFLCPDGFVSTLLTGVQAVVCFFLEPNHGDRRFFLSRHGILSGLVLFLALASSLPQAVLWIGKRGKSSHAMRAELKAALQQWEGAETQEIAVDLSSDRTTSDLIIGDPGAPITVIEFSDFECPFCRGASFALKQQLKEFGGSIKVIFKNFPIDSSCNPNIKGKRHRYACHAALMTRCAWEQGSLQFVAMHNALFLRPELSDEILQALPAELKLNQFRFDTCLQSPATQARIGQDIESAMRVGLKVTPSFFINGKPVAPGTPEVLRVILESLLNKPGSP